MNTVKRQKILKALDIDVWVSRSRVASLMEAEPLISSPVNIPVVAEKAEQEMAKRGRPRKDVVQESKPAAMILELPPITLPQDWDGLRAMVKDCSRCKLCETRTQTVFGVGVENAPLMVVGEGPGADEDAQGEPFVGRAGKLLDEMLKAIGRSRKENVFIANVVKCRPPGNREPEADEAAACTPYLHQQIRLVKPKLIVALGKTAASRLLNSEETLARMRGPIHTYGPDKTPLFVTYHPAYLLRSPREKAKSWDDLKKISRFLKESG